MIQAYFKKFGFVFRLWDLTLETGWYSNEPLCLVAIKILHYDRDINWLTIVGVDILKFSIGLSIDRF